jgi:hypothetical protein
MRNASTASRGSADFGWVDQPMWRLLLFAPSKPAWVQQYQLEGGSWLSCELAAMMSDAAWVCPSDEES